MTVPVTTRATELAIETTNLRKTYRTARGRHVAVAGLDLAVPRGGVHGFLGPNGSGKTTTIRMLLGLARPDSGEMRIFDRPVPEQLPEVIGQIGAIVESPKFFGPFSARLNLQLAADAIGVARESVDQVLDEVGLTSRANDKYSGYSLGMKQRLAVAATLLKQPELLIFDEPTNGLDPSGIHEVRETMRNLGRNGRTVLVSSHILKEVEQVADTVSIIAHGRLLASGTVDEIIGGSARNTIVVGLADVARGAEILTNAGFTVRSAPGGLLVDDVTEPALITAALAAEGLFVSGLSPAARDLEQVFLSVTEGAGLADVPRVPQSAEHSAPRRGIDLEEAAQ